MHSRSFLEIDINNVILLYETGKSLDQIAKEIGVSRTTLERRFKGTGYKFRTVAESSRIAAKRRYGDCSEAIRKYVAGATLRDVSKEFNLPRRHLEKEIIEAGEILRTMSQALGLRYTHLTVEERKSITAKANIAMRGKKAGSRRQERRAKTNELTLQLASRADLILCVWLAQRGVILTPQKAIGPYNIDCAIEELLVAVEVNGHWHYFPSRLEAEAERKKYLFDRGWHLIEVTLTTINGRPWKYLRPACADKIVSILDELRRDKSSISQQIVLGGNGELFSGSDG